MLELPNPTPEQIAALKLVVDRPGLTVEDYANGDKTVYEALAWLIFHRFVIRNPKNQSLTVR